MAGRLQDKVAIVTGAGCVGPGWGNGRAVSVRFAEEGAKVFAVDLNPDALKETLERAKSTDGGTVNANAGEIHGHICDITDGKAVVAMVEACVARFGRVDILVNNVGGSAKGGPVEMSEEVWDRQIDFNLKSVFLTCKSVLPVMEKQGSGAIVNTSSTSGMRWTGAAQSAYAATKAGVIQFSKVAAVEYAARGIRVNTVVPGQLHTPMVEARLAGQRADGDIDALLQSRLARIPLGFMGDGRDTANAALFLASDEARFITGTEIVVDGGMTARCD
ncbi:SDR family NAD(P)-dependent oxidoreductase [Labrenzia sp. OB1]|uniref:SDR family NAD(P)-dependent oxidoreductase n=1 Tax=Labrenzia sp. OB1 TaxID=1561204 RepID=UPI0007B2B4CF|nr:SDR family NAD(P)-dependent oxidoreductase [Labrenzia sp. OB1]KZM48878.1 3-oxoacyl-ACP reductase [Labrenzia sp. OB1]